MSTAQNEILDSEIPQTLTGCPDAEIVCANDETEWLAARKDYITASDVAIILGHHPHKSALTLYNEKIGLLEPDDLSGNENVKWGKRLESVIADVYTEETGRNLVEVIGNIHEQEQQ